MFTYIRTIMEYLAILAFLLVLVICLIRLIDNQRDR